MFAYLHKPLAFSLVSNTINDQTKLLSFVFDFALIVTCLYQEMHLYVYVTTVQMMYASPAYWDIKVLTTRLTWNDSCAKLSVWGTRILTPH